MHFSIEEETAETEETKWLVDKVSYEVTCNASYIYCWETFLHIYFLHIYGINIHTYVVRENWPWVTLGNIVSEILEEGHVISMRILWLDMKKLLTVDEAIEFSLVTSVWNNVFVHTYFCRMI